MAFGVTCVIRAVRWQASGVFTRLTAAPSAGRSRKCAGAHGAGLDGEPLARRSKIVLFPAK